MGGVLVAVSGGFLEEDIHSSNEAPPDFQLKMGLTLAPVAFLVRMALLAPGGYNGQHQPGQSITKCIPSKCSDKPESVRLKRPGGWEKSW